MPPGLWAVGSRLAFLEGHKQEFIDTYILNAGKPMTDWFDNICSLYAEKYHHSLKDTEEPVPGTVYVDVDSEEGGKTPTEIKATLRRRLRNWYDTHCTKKLNLRQTKPKNDAYPFPAFLSVLDMHGPTHARPPSKKVTKYKRVTHIYSDEFYDKIRIAADEQWEVDRLRPLPEGRTQPWTKIETVQSTTTRLYKSESEEVKQEMERLREEHYQEEILADGIKQKEMEDLIQSDEQKQHAINNLQAYLSAILADVSKKTGWAVSIIAGGPVPSIGGQMSILYVHEGRTSGNLGINFGAHSNQLFTHKITPSFTDFLSKVFDEPGLSAGDIGQYDFGPGMVSIDPAVTPSPRRDVSHLPVRIPTPASAPASPTCTASTTLHMSDVTVVTHGATEGRAELSPGGTASLSVGTDRDPSPVDTEPVDIDSRSPSPSLEERRQRNIRENELLFQQVFGKNPLQLESNAAASKASAKLKKKKGKGSGKKRKAVADTADSTRTSSGARKCARKSLAGSPNNMEETGAHDVASNNLAAEAVGPNVLLIAATTSEVRGSQLASDSEQDTTALVQEQHETSTTGHLSIKPAGVKKGVRLTLPKLPYNSASGDQLLVNVDMPTAPLGLGHRTKTKTYKLNNQ